MAPFCAVLATLAPLALAELVLGSAGLGWRTTLAALCAGPGSSGPDDGMATAIVWSLRLPRVILAAIAGAVLAVSGALLQATTRNGLADPFLFGLSSGAAAGAVLVITRGGDRFGSWTLPLAALGGALLSAGCVAALLAVIRRRHRERVAGPEQLVIGGLAISFLFGAVTDLLLFSGDQRSAQSVLFWSLGGFGLARWNNLPLALLGLAAVLATGWWCRNALDALLAGDDTAASVGVAVTRLRLLVFLASAFGTACVVSLSGVIGFVGLMVPHLARAAVGIRHAVMLPVAALGGAALMLAADLASRVMLAGQELPIGIIVSGLGAVFVLALLVLPPAGGRR
ncbi:MAG: iron ABC transporter permease [Gluconacetobacter diazotrophicus]|nr:iron ABC transporter permease [Gluconacetobacter diazotrophicus]